MMRLYNGSTFMGWKCDRCDVSARVGRIGDWRKVVHADVDGPSITATGESHYCPDCVDKGALAGIPSHDSETYEEVIEGVRKEWISKGLR